MAENISPEEQSFNAEMQQEVVEAELSSKSDQLADKESAERAYEDINSQKTEAPAEVKPGDLHRNRASQLEQQAAQMVATADQWRPENPDVHVPQVAKADRLAADLRRQASELKQRAVDLDLADKIADKTDQLVDPETAKKAYDSINEQEYKEEYAKIAAKQQERQELGLDTAISAGKRLDSETAEAVSDQMQKAGASELIDSRFQSLEKASELRDKQQTLEQQGKVLRAGMAADSARKQEAEAKNVGREIDSMVHEAEKNLNNGS